MIANNKKHLTHIEQLARKELSESQLKKVQFLQPDMFVSFLDSIVQKATKKEEIVKGFRVVTEFEKLENMDAKKLQSRIKNILRKKK